MQIGPVTISLDNVYKRLIFLNVNKGMNPDQIKQKMLKTLADINPPGLANLFDITLLNDVVPSD